VTKAANKTAQSLNLNTRVNRIMEKFTAVDIQFSDLNAERIKPIRLLINFMLFFI
jgi:hypothetical protein